MAQWTASVSAAHLARLLEPRPHGGGRRKLPAYRGLADGVRLLVLEGRVQVAARLPAERELALALGVSRTTVAAAYEALRAEGFARSRRGSGSWTAIPEGHVLPSRSLEPLPPDAAGTVIDLGTASLPAPEPWLTRAMESALADLPAYAATHGDFPAGLPVLREAIADRYTARGVPTMPEQIMVTTGAMGAIGAAARRTVGYGERVAVEAPSYANVLELFRETGARLVPVALRENLAGWDMDAWRRVLRDAAPRMAYVMPDFHNPTGTLVGDDQRRELVEAARVAGTVLVADETMAELVLDGPEAGVRPMAAFDRGGTVMTVGSASKTVWAGLRIGWVRSTPDVVRRLVSARAYLDLGSPVVDQLAVAWLLRGEVFEQALAARRLRARECRDDLAAALRAHTPGWEFTVPRGGMTMWVRTGDVSGSRLAVAGERLGVRVPSGPRFGVDGAFESFIRVPFTVSGQVAKEAGARLAEAADVVRSGGGADGEGSGLFVA
ncbi:MocR-like transcription factor YczR [Actinacidiphila acididurans]|uniref:PLP-dependent aminotransferase family protein n=1 Tax=Actinacidiphila acididurans TaxID=2784346 RepID=A0ABS2U423_9ACTN|nr:PLP-dependent aminotransferase family protein [Actinacidiphila acididurans]MBM9510339.1 PLP-dependent aminotransferase family protein [Actinacidiphila acididurans]